MTLTGMEKTYLYEEHSAAFWSTNLGSYSERMARTADRFALVAAGISALTGAAIWTTLSDSTKWWAQTVVAAMAAAAAMVGMWPKQAGYSDCAMKSAGLAGDYGRVLVKLRLAHDHWTSGLPDGEKELLAAIEEFQTTREQKQNLKPYPANLDAMVHEEYRRLRIDPEI